MEQEQKRPGGVYIVGGLKDPNKPLPVMPHREIDAAVQRIEDLRAFHKTPGWFASGMALLELIEGKRYKFVKEYCEKNQAIVLDWIQEKRHFDYQHELRVVEEALRIVKQEADAAEVCFYLGQLHGTLTAYGKMAYPEPSVSGMAREVAPHEPIPVTIHFENACLEDGHSDYRPFSTWTNYLVQVCMKCVEQYGADEVRSYLLAPETRAMFNKGTVPFFTETPEEQSNRKYHQVTSGLFVRTNMSKKNIYRLVDTLMSIYPKAKATIIWA